MKNTHRNRKPIKLKSVGEHIKEAYKTSPEFRKAYDEEVVLLKISYKIARLRKMRHMTQKDLAKSIGTTQQTISRLEDSGNTQITLHTLTRVAMALNARLNIDIIPKE